MQLHEIRNHPVLKVMMYVVIVVVVISFIFFYGWHANDQASSQIPYARLKSDGKFGGWQNLYSYDLKEAKSAAIAENANAVPQQMMQQMTQSQREQLVTPGDVAAQAANDEISRRRAEQLGVRITREDMINSYNQIPNITQAAVVHQADVEGFNGDVDAFIEHHRRLQQNAIVGALQSQAAHVSLFELWQEYQLAKEKIKLRVAAYPISSFTASVPVTDTDLQQYLDAHKTQFALPEQRRYEYAKLSLSDLRENLTVTSTALQGFYAKNQAQFHEKAGFKTEEIVAPLAGNRSTTDAVKALNGIRAAAANTDWSTLAASLRKANPKLTFYERKSDDWLTADDTKKRSALFLSRAAALSNDQVSTPVVEEDNVYLIKIIERRKEGTPPLDKIHDNVEAAYRDAQAQILFKAAADRWDTSLTNAKSVAEFAKTVGAADQLTTRVTNTDYYLPGFGSLYKDRAYVEGLKLHEVSSLVKTEDMIGVLEISEATPAHDPSLTEAHAAVEKAYRKEKADVLAKAQAEQSLKLLNSGAQFDLALADAPHKPYVSEPFTRGDQVSGLDAPLMNFTTSTLGLRVGSSGLSPYGTQDPDGYAVWKVEQLSPPTRADFTHDRAQFTADFMQVQQLAMRREWLADERRNTKFELLNIAE